MKNLLSGKIIIGVLCFILLAGSLYIVAEGIPAWAYDVGYCAAKCIMYDQGSPEQAACVNGCLYGLSV